MSKDNRFKSFESDRKTRVKLYKSGKQWVTTLMSRIGLLHIATGPAEASVRAELTDDLQGAPTARGLLKTAAATGVFLGGAAVATHVTSADETAVEQDASSAGVDTLATSDEVAIPSDTSDQEAPTASDQAQNDESTERQAQGRAVTVTTAKELRTALRNKEAEIVLGADIDCSKDFATVGSLKDFTIDGQGHSLNLATYQLQIVAGSQVEIKNTNIYGTNYYGPFYYSGASADSRLTIEDSTYTGA